MNFFDLILIGLALGLDAFIITLSNCANFSDNLSRKKELLMPVLFSFFQFFMPLLGFFIGSLFIGFIEKISGYLASGIFYFLAVKLIIDTFKKDKNGFSNQPKKSKLSALDLIMQAVATSIDALIVGAGLVGNLKIRLITATITIGIVTLVLVFLGLFLGKKLKNLLGEYANLFCIFILLFLATKNLVLALT